ncbi:hypothetical protein BMG03_10000 [Thioclava nitratireducens]|uniref:Uncharacterized protein n=1 Tax=Thioclava nitratireducens TaxID=1915078 RepID=A0ABM6IHC0_9RHOB|nr:hypothetical protein [Thioclava nitratireducens]AQS48095.1 hypothetical protein BMG03_10000 [Thioclava nitratireducens]
MSGTRRLWQAVLYQAVDDALNGAALDSETVRRRNIEQARELLSMPNRDLEMICTGAGLEMEGVVRRMRKLIAEAPPLDELVAGKTVRQRAEIEKREPRQKRKRPNPTYTYKGETLTIGEWSKKVGLAAGVIRARMRNGWTFERAITTSVVEARLQAREKRSERIKEAMKGRTWARGTPPRMITHEGETLTLGEWAERLGVTKQTIRKRLAKGLTVAG